MKRQVFGFLFFMVLIFFSGFVYGAISESQQLAFDLAPTITVTSPNGGESWEAGSSHEITWNSTGSVGNVKIEYSTDNGIEWTDIVTSTDNDGSYSWAIAGNSSDICLVRVSETDGEPTDVSDAVFSIDPPPIPAAERNALIALYNATDGDNWLNKIDYWKVDGNFGAIGSEGTWYGVTVENIAGENHVTKIDLSDNILIGSIPAELGNLGNLTHLYLDTNQLSGSIPPGLGNLSSLTSLFLDSNQLSGGIPAELGNLSNLIHLYLSFNELNGSIPPGLGNLSNLTHLYLNSNELTSRIPAGLGSLSNLEFLYLNNNLLSGPVPGDFKNLTKLSIPNVNIGYNCLYVHNDIELQDRLNAIDPDWETNQSECNAEPTITITAPDSNITIVKGQSNNTIDISWDGSDPGNEATVRIGYDEDKIYYNSERNWIGLPTSFIDGSRSWDTSEVATGTYYIFGFIDDGENNDYNYAEGSVTILLNPIIPTVETNTVTSITSNSAVCGYNVTSDGGTPITARGVCWNTSENPTTEDSHTTDGTGVGSFTSSLTGLTPDTTYYVRAYATNSLGTSYGNEENFTTNSGATTYTLYVKSTPQTGVPITVNTYDNYGHGSGHANFNRTYNSGTEVTLTAPETYYDKSFLKWVVDGADKAGRTITITMDNDHTARAVYQSATYTLTVQSSPDTGVEIKVSPRDNNDQGEGNTEFFRTYNFNEVVTLTAPPSYEEKNFVKWLIDGTGDTDQTVQVTMDRNHTAHAVFQSPTYKLTVQSSPSPGIAISVSPDDNNGDGDGNTIFDRTYNSGTIVTLTAPPSINGDDFIRWTVDGQDNPNTTIQLTIDSNHTAAAHYEASSPPEIYVNRKQLNFGYIIGSNVPLVETFTIDNKGGGTINWSVKCELFRVSLNPESGTNYGVVEVTFNPAGLPPGKFDKDVIRVIDPLVSNSPVDVRINLVVKEQSAPPFGEFSTPADGSTVRSSVPVTGWALADTGVESVKIYREDGANLVFIGDAVFVEGARPDIEDTFPNYPMNYKAGWGYMMLTNSLPNGGNGEFKIRAIATDKDGQQTTLGVKTIFVDNANAVKPFGAIDTPTQGGTASGSNFINWGWVLTPQPNSIPIDGSTIKVWVDGIDIGSPTYNIYRADIAGLFPGYANSNGAIGYFYLDTTAYENGVHTIQWTAADDAGNSDGIGSRFFTIQNTGGSANRTAEVLNVQRSMLNGERSRIPIDYWTPVMIKKDNRNINPREMYPDEEGIINIEIKELERLEIHFFDIDGAANISSWKSINNVSSLPTGSTFDSSRGVFYWLPGPGFIGDYEFEFIKAEGNSREKVRIKIKILPKFSK